MKREPLNFELVSLVFYQGMYYLYLVPKNNKSKRRNTHTFPSSNRVSAGTLALAGLPALGT